MKNVVNDEQYIDLQVNKICSMYEAWSKVNEQQTFKLIEIAETIKTETDKLIKRRKANGKDLASLFDDCLYQRLGFDKAQVSRLRKIGEHADKLREVAYHMGFGEHLGYQLSKLNEEIGLDQIQANGGMLPTSVMGAAQARAAAKNAAKGGSSGNGGASLRITLTGWQDPKSAAEATLSIVRREKTVRAKVPKGVTAAMIASDRITYDEIASRVTEY